MCMHGFSLILISSLSVLCGWFTSLFIDALSDLRTCVLFFLSLLSQDWTVLSVFYSYSSPFELRECFAFIIRLNFHIVCFLFLCEWNWKSLGIRHGGVAIYQQFFSSSTLCFSFRLLLFLLFLRLEHWVWCCMADFSPATKFQAQMHQYCHKIEQQRNTHTHTHEYILCHFSSQRAKRAGQRNCMCHKTMMMTTTITITTTMTI